MGGKCFKEINIANSIQVSREKEKEAQHDSNINLIQANNNTIKNKENEPLTTKKSYKTITASSTKIVKEDGLVGQRKSKVFTGVHNMKNNDNLTSQTYKNQEGDNFKILKEKNKELQDYEIINKCIGKHFFMRSLDKNSRNDIIKEMSLVYLPENTVIFQQGDIGKYFYIIQSGEVNLNINANSNKTIITDESFGELALLHSAPRSGTCITITECYFWILERNMFRKIIEQINKMNFEENKKFVQSIAILDLIEKDQKAILISNLLKEAYETGDYIVKGK
jgi:hypothetical protein